MAKERLDKLVTQRDLFPSRSQAKRAIMAGLVLVDEQVVDKAGTQIDVEAEIRVKGEIHPYVSRGGLKLEKALKEFAISLEDKVVLDIGASTGGFTDCALEFGARQVYAVDVGYGQLAWKLRQDQRVVNLERTNARYLTPEDFEVKFDLATVDVAFISLTKILPALVDLLVEQGEVLALIKPQFEAGPEKVNNKGVVKDLAVHKEVIRKVVDCAQGIGLRLIDFSFSPITGAKGGNIEYLAYFSLDTNIKKVENLAEKLEKVIAAAKQMNN